MSIMLQAVESLGMKIEWPLSPNGLSQREVVITCRDGEIRMTEGALGKVLLPLVQEAIAEIEKTRNRK